MQPRSVSTESFMLRRATFDANLSSSSLVFGKVQAEYEDEHDDEDDSERNLTNVWFTDAGTVHWRPGADS